MNEKTRTELLTFFADVVQEELRSRDFADKLSATEKADLTNRIAESIVSYLDGGTLAGFIGRLRGLIKKSLAATK